MELFAFQPRACHRFNNAKWCRKTYGAPLFYFYTKYCGNLALALLISLSLLPGGIAQIGAQQHVSTGLGNSSDDPVLSRTTTTTIATKHFAPYKTIGFTPYMGSTSFSSQKKTASTQGDTAERIILVYPLDGCRAQEAVQTGEEARATTSYMSTVFSPLKTRENVFSVLEQRVNAELSKRRSSVLSAAHRRGLEPLSGERSSLLSFPDETSVRLQTRYLDTLQMEVTKVPEDVTADDMIRLTKDIPCLQFAAKDYMKTIPSDNDLYDNSFPSYLPPQHENENFSLKKMSNDNSTGNILFAKNKLQNDEGSTNSEKKFLEKTNHRNSNGNFSFSEQNGTRRLRQTSRILEEQFANKYTEIETPNDPLFAQQWHFHDKNNWGIGAQEGWKMWKGRETFVVAIIDSGCDLSHPDLVPKLWVNDGEICDDGIDNDGNGYVDDCHGWDWANNDNDPSPEGNGHGTAASGIIAAATNNNGGVAGICWECRIMCLKFIDAINGRVSNQVSAIDYAAKMGARISNNSYGGYGFSLLEFEVIRRVRALGHLFVTSAGNNNHDTDIPRNDHTPSTYALDNIVAVGASTISGAKARFSNFGQTSVDVFAPGSRITTIATGAGYKSVSGTSFAAPMVSGIAALIWSRYPDLSYKDLIKVILDSCNPSPSLSEACACGGVVHLPNALREAQEAQNRMSEHVVNEFRTQPSENNNLRSKKTVSDVDTSKDTKLNALVELRDSPQRVTSPVKGTETFITHRVFGGLGHLSDYYYRFIKELETAFDQARQKSSLPYINATAPLPRVSILQSPTYPSVAERHEPLRSVARAVFRWLPVTSLTALFRS